MMSPSAREEPAAPAADPFEPLGAKPAASAPAPEPADDLDRARRRRHTRRWVLGLMVALLVTIPVAVGIGPVRIDAVALSVKSGVGCS
jgi:hypothetical protein